MLFPWNFTKRFARAGFIPTNIRTASTLWMDPITPAAAPSAGTPVAGVFRSLDGNRHAKQPVSPGTKVVAVPFHPLMPP
jgi:hypothetical protein